MTPRAVRAKRARRSKGTCPYCRTVMTVGSYIALLPGTGWAHASCVADRMRTQPKENHVKTARYVGGPLDGQTVEKTGGRWCFYRDDDGQPISTKRGDEEWYAGPRSGRPMTRFYASKQRRGLDLYIHATVWPEWKDKVK